MYNAVNKALAITATSFLLITACSTDNGQSAQDMLQEAQTLYEAGNYNGAADLLDSIDTIFPGEIAVRKQALALRPQIILKQTEKEIVTNDSLRVLTDVELSENNNLLIATKAKGLLEPYYTLRGWGDNFIGKTGIEPRINNENLFYIVAQTSGENIGLNGIALNIAGAVYSTNPIPSGSERLISVEGSNLVSFLPEEVDEIGRVAYENPTSATITLNGTKGRKTIKLTEAQTRALGAGWHYAKLKAQERELLIERERLERKRNIARDQIANLAVPEQQ